MIVIDEKKKMRPFGFRVLSYTLLFVFILISSLPAVADNTSQKSPDLHEDSTWNERYAVALFGIQHDAYKDCGGKRAGLTFGPATGEYFLNGYRAHVSEQEYTENPGKNICLHWMTWQEIAAQSLDDPTVFRACLEYGCTHAVDIKLNGTLLYKDYSSTISGDGASVLFDELKRDYCSWSNGMPVPGGWPSCRARVVLNGADEYSDPDVVGEQYLLSSEESLFSCFPQDLQDLIVAKAVVSDLAYDEKTGSCVTTYDKLWLFSANEVYGSHYAVKNTEGEPYERNILIHSGKVPFHGGLLMHSERGTITWAWFRSQAIMADVLNYHIFGGGHRTASSHYNYFGLTPGFCLA